MIFDKIKIVLIGIASIFNYNSAPKENVEIVDYETEYVYAEKYSEGEELIIREGEYGYSYYSDGQEIEYKEPVNQIVQVGTHKNADYKGILTGYGADCKGCTGYVACKTENKKIWNLIDDGVIYNDSDYGEVNIVAADRSLFPCGTIIEITNSKYDHVLAVVLDTGYDMRRAWRNNNRVHLDLAFEAEKGTNSVTNKNTKYHVKRWGW